MRSFKAAISFNKEDSVTGSLMPDNEAFRKAKSRSLYGFYST